MPHLVYIVTHPVTARSFLRGQLSMMRHEGFDVTLISSPGQELDAVGRSENVRTIVVPMEREISLSRDPKSLLQLTRVLRELKPDIVNAGTPKAGLLGMLAARAAGVPARVYMLRGLRVETARGVKAKILSATERIAAACAHRVVCVSESLRQAAITRELVPAKKALVLGAGSSNGVDFARFQFERTATEIAAQREQLGIPADAFVIGFVGRLVRDKGIVELLRAFESLSAAADNVRLLILGNIETGDPLPADTLDALARDPRIVQVGYVESPAAYYGVMNLLAFPSYREGFPNVPLEAAAAGLPVVGFRATGTVDAVIDGVTGTLVPTGDADALAAAMLRYQRDAGLVALHGTAGRVRAERDFQPQRISQELAKLYWNLLDENRERRGSESPARQTVTSA